MGTDDLDQDEDQQDGDTGSDSAPVGMPPAGPADPRQQLAQAIMASQAAAKTNANRLSDIQTNIGQEQARNSLLASLAKSSAQVGSFNGHVADTSSVGDMAKSLDQGAQGQYADLIRRANTQQQGAALDARVMGYLTPKGRRYQTAGQDANGNLLALDGMTGQVVNTGQQGSKLAPPAKEPQAKFINVGQDADGNLLVMDQTTGKVVSTGQKGTKVAAAPKPGAGAGGLGDDAPPDPKLVNAERSKLADVILKSGSRSNIGKLQSKINGAEALETLLAAHPDGQIPPQFQTELAMGLANLVSGGTATQAEIEHMDPQTRGTYIANLMQKLTNEPYSADNPKFAKLFGETIAREKGTAQDQLGRAFAQARYAAPNFYKADPQGFFGLLGAKPGDFDTSGGNFAYVPKVLGKTVPQTPEGGSGTAYAAPAGSAAPSAAAHPKAADAAAWANANRMSPDPEKAAMAHQILQRLGGG